MTFKRYSFNNAYDEEGRCLSSITEEIDGEYVKIEQYRELLENVARNAALMRQAAEKIEELKAERDLLRREVARLETGGLSR